MINGAELTWGAVQDALEHARATFLRNDCDLLELNVNERSMTHKFAEYLQHEFPDWHVDCEYNRRGDVKKRLPRWVTARRISPADEDARTVYPDIIVHRRNSDENVLVIEAKTADASDREDRAKLNAFLSLEEFKYSYAVLLRFVTHRPYSVNIERFEGARTPWGPQ